MICCPSPTAVGLAVKVIFVCSPETISFESVKLSETTNTPVLTSSKFKSAVPSDVVALVTLLVATVIVPNNIEWLLVNAAPCEDTKVTGKV